MSKRKQHPIFYGLQEPLLVLRWISASQGVLVLRAAPLYRKLKRVDSPGDLHFLMLAPQLMVCQVMNYVTLLEEHRLSASAKAVPAIEKHLATLNASGYALCVGQALDALKTSGSSTPIEWCSQAARFLCKDTPSGTLFQIAVGSNVAVPAFRTRWIGTQDLCRRTYEYVSKRGDGNAKSRGVSKRD